MRLRSLLYVPAHQQRFIAKAHERGADALILDLEDAVPEAEKDRAREGLAASVAAVGQRGTAVFVRINAGARALEDARAACRAGAFGLMLPKVAETGGLAALAGMLRAEEAALGRATMPFIAIIEHPAALLEARAIAGFPRVIALCLGSEDFAFATGATPTPEVLRLPKLLLHYAAKAEGKLSLGLLQSIADYGDVDALQAAAREARAHGFNGATCIHPSAIPALNTAFSPSPSELDWARGVLAAAAEADGAFAYDGRMVDAPVLARARRLLQQADAEG